MNELKLLRDVLTLKSENLLLREQSEGAVIRTKDAERKRAVSLQTALGGELLKSPDLKSIVNLFKLGERCKERVEELRTEISERKLGAAKLARERERLTAGGEYVEKVLSRLISKLNSSIEESELDERRR